MIWILIIFSFNINHMTLETQEFKTAEACNQAKKVIESALYSPHVNGSPAQQTTKVACIQDSL